MNMQIIQFGLAFFYEMHFDIITVKYCEHLLSHLLVVPMH